MPDLLAIVSKGVFEAEAGDLGVGQVWATRAYASTNKALAPLARGGSLFLVTVRPDQVLWLVAILDGPKASKGAWRAAANAVPIANLTDAISRITFANGKGLVRDAKLGMSLQTPRELAAEAAALLRAVAAAGSTKPAKAVKAAKSTQAASKSATAPGSATDPRPPGIPEDARWDAWREEWEHGELDAQGSRQGVWRIWRADGSLRGECTHRDHEPHGTNRRFHPDGSLASEAEWRDGVIGDAIYFNAPASDEPTLPAPVARAVFRTTDGFTNATIEYYDAAGRAIDGAGVRVPARPRGVPETARFFSDHDFGAPDGSIGGWVDGRIERGTSAKIGHWRWWSVKGALLLEERTTETGKPIEVGDVAVAIDRFCLGDAAPKRAGDDPEPAMQAWRRRYDLAQVWCDDVHATIRARLASLPRALVREYVAVLRDDIEEYRRAWSMKVPQRRAILEVVDDWAAREPRAKDADTGYCLAAGTEAAFALGDRARAARWWKRAATCAKPTRAERDATHVFADLEDGLAERRAAITAFLANEPAKLTAKATDAQLERAAAAAFGGRYTCLVRDRRSGEAWLHGEAGTAYFDGTRLARSDVEVDDRAPHDVRHVAPYDGCDERVVLWPGKHGWLVLQRYGRRVLWHEAKYYVSRGQPEVERILWLRAPSPAYARRLMGLIRAASSGREIDPWFDKKLGVILRRYSGEGTTTLGVHGTTLTTGRTVLETFATHADAVRAFEDIELERLRGGSYLSRFAARMPGASDDD